MSDPQPPAFPRISDSPADEKTVVDGPIFSRPGAQAKQESTPAPPPQTPGAPLFARDYRARWAVVGIATLVAVAVIGAFIVFTGPKGGTPSTVARYAPADTVAYFEARLDLPGDQHNSLAAFMSHFPGFADQAAFDQKFEETLSQFLASGELETSLDWEHDVEPWFGGEVGVFSSTVSPEPGTPPSVTAAFSVKDKAALEEWLTNAGDIEMYEGQEIHTGPLLPGGFNLAATDDALLAGRRIEDVRAALDVRADRQPGLADDPFFLQQLGVLPADYLGLVYYDGRGAAEQLRNQLDDLGQLGQPLLGDLIDWVIDASAARSLAEVRAESDHLAMTTRSERPPNADMPPLPGNRATTLAEAALGDSLAYAEIRDVGQTISFVLGKFLAPAPGASPPVDLSNFEGILGTPIQNYFDFILDVGASVSYSGDEVTAGFVATVDDNAIAGARVDRLLTLARSLMQFGGGITFTDETHGDADITLIGLGGPAGEFGLGSIAVTVSNGRLYVGNGDFVVDALDRTRDTSLAARPEYVAALQAGGSNNAGIVFVDVAAARGIVEANMPDLARSGYELNQKPFLAPLSHLAVINTTEGTTSVSHVFLYVE